MPSQTIYQLPFVSRGTITALSTLLILTTSTQVAQAQDSIFTVPAPHNETYADVGVAGVVRDTYVGSGETDFLVLPFVNAEYKGRLFFKPGLGAGVYAIKNDNFRLSASANLALGRDTEDTPFLNQGFDEDLLEIDTTVTAAISGRYYLPFGAIDLIGTIPVGGDLDGQRVDALLTTEIRPIKNLRITPGVRATYQSSGWLNSIYGLDTNQAATLGVDAFSLGGQVSTIGAHAVSYYQLPNKIELNGVINYSRLLGDVNDSPLTASRNSITAAIGITRQF